MPAALLQAALLLAKVWGDLPRALATVTANPARHVGLTDRGQIAIGKRGDLLQFAVFKNAPIVKKVWVQGARVS